MHQHRRFRFNLTLNLLVWHALLAEHSMNTLVARSIASICSIFRRQGWSTVRSIFENKRRVRGGDYTFLLRWYARNGDTSGAIHILRAWHTRIACGDASSILGQGPETRFVA